MYGHQKQKQELNSKFTNHDRTVFNNRQARLPQTSEGDETTLQGRETKPRKNHQKNHKHHQKGRKRIPQRTNQAGQAR